MNIYIKVVALHVVPLLCGLMFASCLKKENSFWKLTLNQPEISYPPIPGKVSFLCLDMAAMK